MKKSGKLSKWSIFYYFFKDFLQQLITIFLFFNVLLTGMSLVNYLYILLFWGTLKIFRGLYLWKSTNFYIGEKSIIINKGILTIKQTEILVQDIQSVRIKESFWSKKLNTFDLSISIKGQLVEGKEIELSCIPVKYKEELCNKLNVYFEEFEKSSNKSWTISIKQIMQASLSSITWTYLLSLAYVKDDIQELGTIPVISIIINYIEKFIYDGSGVISFIKIYLLGIFFAFVINCFLYYNFKVYIYQGEIYTSRGFIEKHKAKMKIKDISSFSVSSTIISSVLGYGKLVADGQADENDNLSLTIFPFEKKEMIRIYMKEWFSIDNYRNIELKKDKLVKVFEALSVGVVFALIYNLIRLFFHKYQFVLLIFLIYICINLVIRIVFSYVSMGDEIAVIHKAGITNRISYIRSSDIVSLEVEDNFLQRKLNYVNLYIHYISCNDEESIKLRNFRKEKVNKLIAMWR